jgi:hypothetical protein
MTDENYNYSAALGRRNARAEKREAYRRRHSRSALNWRSTLALAR